MTNLQKVNSELMTLQNIADKNYQFVIPSYQRPYVWPDSDVLKLFEDIEKAWQAKERLYFIGTILTAEQNPTENTRILELIDGQQRTTTLVLIALAFRKAGINAPLSNIAVLGKQPRLQFTIRHQVQNLLGGLAGLEQYQLPSANDIKNDPYLTHLDATLSVLIKKVDALKYQATELADYIFNNVQWVNNCVPRSMDLNLLFSTMNTAGIQLEASDILKSRLLKKIKSNKAFYDAIWQTCQHLENFFERNARQTFTEADWDSITDEQLAVVPPTLNVYAKEETHSVIAMNISELFSQVHEEFETEKQELSLQNKDGVYCRSIISFPLLLIHVYRIHLARHGQPDISTRLHTDKLLEIFSHLCSAEEQEIKRFFELLWKTRYQFDRWVIKWMEQDKENEELRLTYVSRSRSGNHWYINRSQKEINALTLLQSVRLFTGERSAQYWLTPFLGKLLEQPGDNEQQVLALLEKIDNELSMAADNETQKSVSFKQAKSENASLRKWAEIRMYFSENHGTRFEHYWFQKLEFLLWKKYQSEWKDNPKFKKYRITAKNSVEHVYPQQEEYQRYLDKESLDSFGNLVLLSPGENSAYSNQAVGKKKIDFDAKPVFDSLKLKAIFETRQAAEEAWGEEQISQHQQEMLKVFDAHYIE
ncbi:DUF262 domain-containing protein [Franconibacter pulveris]|uniref:DUF262 domain-containing protein n=1 Tax=Franconibacter pulveris TaxID=435910 RepID=UPI00049763F9|nr:DUF262 domain-containing protein [Franconibacter pulveris]